MKPVLIFVDNNEVETETNRLEQTQYFLQSIVDRFNALALGADAKLKDRDLIALFAGPKPFIVDKVTKGESLSIGALSISKEKAFEILELPQDLHNVLIDVDGARLGTTHDRFLHRNQVDKFVIIDEVVEISEDFLKGIIKKNSIYLKTIEELKAWELMKEIANKLNELRDITKNKGINLNTIDLESFFAFSENMDINSKNEPNPKVLKKLFNI